MKHSEAGSGPENDSGTTWRLDVSDGISSVLRDLGVGITLQNRDLIYVDARNRCFGLEPDKFHGQDDDHLLGGFAASELRRLKQAVVASREPAQGEFRIDTAGQESVWHRVCVGPSSADGEVEGLVSASIDVTAKRLADEHLRLALLELSHRAKNLLAIVLSIARQTSIESLSLAQFESRFEGRIRALALSHDILTDEHWRGASVFGLARSQLATLQAPGGGHFETAGYNAYLVPNAAQHVGLALHELATWSRLSGALSSPGGMIKLSCERLPVGPDGASNLMIRWHETGIPMQAGREESAFGQIVLSKIVPAAISASAQIERPESTSLVYELVLPQANFF